MSKIGTRTLKPTFQCLQYLQYGVIHQNIDPTLKPSWESHVNLVSPLKEPWMGARVSNIFENYLKKKSM